MKYSRAQRAAQRQPPDTTAPNLIAEDNDSGRPVFFWREYEEPYGFLCQFYGSEMRDPEVHPTHVFTCAEQYMMYRKALILLSHPVEQLPASKKKDQPQPKPTATANEQQGIPARILLEQKPARQKDLAREVRPTQAALKAWESVKFEVVVQGSWCKYSQNPTLKARLLATGDRELVEASPNDGIWGIGIAAEIAETNREGWGSNLLGKALMTVRERLKAEVEEEVERGREKVER